VVGLDVEHDRDYVHVQPQTRAQVGRLLEKSESDTRSEELAEMFTAEFPQGLQDVLLNISRRLLGVFWVVRNACRCEIGAVNRIVDTQGYFD